MQSFVDKAMDFESYSKLIDQSIAECGYDRFLPSLCVSTNDKDELNVLETELFDDGERSIALDWASQFTNPSQKLFCAYRIGEGKIEIVAILGWDVTEKTHIDVVPFAGDQ